MSDEPTPRRREFLERWALLNLGLALSGLMIGLALAQAPTTEDTPALPVGRLITLGILSAWLLPNGVYLAGSLHYHLRNRWAEQRGFWIKVTAIAVAWTFVVLLSAARKP